MVLFFAFVYTSSPTKLQPIEDIWTRIWCVRPVSRLHCTKPPPFYKFQWFCNGLLLFFRHFVQWPFFYGHKASGDIARDCSLFGRGNTVNDSIVSPLNGMVKKTVRLNRDGQCRFLPQPECRSCFCQYDGQFRVLLRRRFRIENSGNDTKGH